MTGVADPHGDRELEAVLHGVPAPRARAEFRSALRERFVDVALGEQGDVRDPGATGRAAPQGAARSRPRFGLLLGSIAAAAAIVLLIMRMTLHQPASWTVLSGTGIVIVDGVRIDASDTRRLADALRSAKTIETSESALRIELRDELVLDLDPRTRLENVRFPAVSPYALTALSGAVHVATTNAFRGGKLSISTADLEIDCVGTVFGVDLLPNGTCLCCVEGAVSIAPRARSANAAPRETITADRSCFVEHGSETLHKVELVSDHAHVLRELSAWLKTNAAR